MDLRTLRCFLVTAKRLHFGQASEELGIAQPALSQRIKALEGRLGVELFDRTKRAVRLSPAGKAFAGEAERLVNEGERAMRIARAADKGTAGELHIGYSGSVIFEPRICDLLQSFRNAFPDVSMLMYECGVEDQLEGIKTGRLDISLFWGPVGPGYPELRHLNFSQASMSVVLRRDHVLAGRSEIHLEEIENEAFIALMDPPGRGLVTSLMSCLSMLTCHRRSCCVSAASLVFLD